jgi:penicillin amidase
MRKLLWGAAALVLVLGLASGAGLFYLRTALPDYNGEKMVAGLSAPVEVWRDSAGVPHIWAATPEDLFFAQGYVHAQDRLWQMELFRRVADGRLAEVLGADLLESDKFLRTIGLGRAARAGAGTLDPGRRAWLEAYAAGVNAWIDGHRGALPPEFVALRIRPEPWEIEHSLMLEKIMAWDLAAYQRGLDLAGAVRRLGPERAVHLAPEYPDWGVRIIGGAPGDSARPAQPHNVLAPAVARSVPPAVPPLAAALLDALSITRASNAWVVAGERTRTGKPILANDMHLSLTSPSLWYLAALHGGEFEVAGMTLPGAPFVVAGHNRAIAWGLTNAYLDDADLILERADPADSTRYLTPDGSLPFMVLVDTIEVRGSAEPVLFPIRWTRHGPILNDVEARAAEELVALRWVGHDPSRTWEAMAGLNLASNWEEFVAAVSDFDNPHQNVVYADTAGHIGYYMGGRVPLRGAGERPPLLPVPGWSGEWEWVGDLPFAEHPQALDPRSGYVVTANNRQVAGSLGDLISRSWEEPFRAERIVALIEGGGTLDAEVVHAHQLDIRDALAERYRDVAVAAAERTGLAEAAELLRGWDLEARPESRAAALFYTWHDRLRQQAARSLYSGGDTPPGEATRADDMQQPLAADPNERALWVPRDALTPVLERRAFPWVEGGGAEEFAARSALALREADSIVGGRRWGELQVVVAEHPMGKLGWLDRLLGLNVGPAPLGGSSSTVNVAHRTGSGYPRRVTYGASQRHVVDMGDIDGAGGFILPTGQSGIPFSKHYRDHFERWRSGGLWVIPLDRERALARSIHRMTLRPQAEASR